MNETEQRIAIAEFCGWSLILKHSYTGLGTWVFNGEMTDPSSSPPNYLHDLNAMHEAESHLDAEQIGDWEQWIHDAIGTRYFVPHASPSTGEVFKVAHATAAQRAVALLKTIGKWKEIK